MFIFRYIVKLQSSTNFFFFIFYQTIALLTIFIMNNGYYKTDLTFHVISVSLHGDFFDTFGLHSFKNTFFLSFFHLIIASFCFDFNSSNFTNQVSCSSAAPSEMSVHIKKNNNKYVS